MSYSIRRRWPTSVDLPEAAVLARTAFDTYDYSDSYAIRLESGVRQDPRVWAHDIFFHQPFPDMGHSGHEALIGESLKHIHFVVSVLIQDDVLTMSTVVRFRTRIGPLYFVLVKPFHRAFVRLMLWRAVRVARRQAARSLSTVVTSDSTDRTGN